jgi:glycosyltransferase involved in cell wall biosynthesis
MNRLKVVQIVCEGKSGSTGRIAEAIGQEILNQGALSFIFVGRDQEKSESSINKVGGRFNLYFHAFLTRLTDLHGLGSIYATIKLVTRLIKIKPHIIHLHHIHGYYINYFILFKFLEWKNCNVVWTFHDCWAYTGHCTHYSMVKCNKWKTECKSCPQRSEYPQSWFLDASLFSFRLKRNTFSRLKNLHIVCVSEWMRNEVRGSFLSHIDTSVIHNGIDINVFKSYDDNYETRLKYGLKENDFVLISVAFPWRKAKGLDDIIALSSILPKECKIVLVGINPDLLKGCSGIVAIPRTKNKSELAKLYSCSDLYLGLSYEESFGLTVAESLSCGTPVVVYSTTALPELVNDDVGFIIPEGEYSKICDIVSEILISRREKPTHKCRTWALDKFNQDKNIKYYTSLYNDFLKSK